MSHLSASTGIFLGSAAFIDLFFLMAILISSTVLRVTSIQRSVVAASISCGFNEAGIF